MLKAPHRGSAAEQAPNPRLKTPKTPIPAERAWLPTREGLPSRGKSRTQRGFLVQTHFLYSNWSADALKPEHGRWASLAPGSGWRVDTGRRGLHRMAQAPPIDKSREKKTKNKTHSVDFFFMLPEFLDQQVPTLKAKEQGTKNAPYLHQCRRKPCFKLKNKRVYIVKISLKNLTICKCIFFL